MDAPTKSPFGGWVDGTAQSDCPGPGLAAREGWLEELTLRPSGDGFRDPDADGGLGGTRWPETVAAFPDGLGKIGRG